MELSDSFRVQAPVAQVWALVWDLPRLAACLPGCEGLVAVDSSRYRAKVRRSVGPFHVALELELEVQEAVPERRVVVTGGGADKLGNMLKVQRTVLELEPLSPGETQVSYRLEFTLFGKLGTLGYAVVKRKAEEMRAEFTRRMVQVLAGPDQPAPEARPQGPEGPESRYIQARSLWLRCLDWGGTGRQPLLLLHGLQDCARCWAFFAEAVRDRYRVLALDARGHGDSQWAIPPAYWLADYVGELAEVVEKLGLQDLVLMGHSAGSKNAWMYAAQHPERIAKLVIVDMDPDSHNPGSVQMVTRYKAESDQYPDLQAVIERLRSRSPKAPEELLRHQALHMTHLLPGARRLWKRDRNVVTLYHRPDVWDALPHINAPTLLVRGAESTLLTRPVAQRMQQAIPNCTLAELHGAGHWCHHEQPQAFTQTVLDFLGPGR